MMFPKETRIEDKAYRERPKHERMECENCLGSLCHYSSVVGAHPRPGTYSGAGQKPCDRLIMFLGHDCHAIQENGGVQWLAHFLLTRMLRVPWPEDDPPTEMEALWLVKSVFWPLRIRMYDQWKAKQ